jgi:hypothetical protein
MLPACDRQRLTDALALDKAYENKPVPRPKW